MSIENLRMFQTAVNTYSASDGDTKVGFDTVEDDVQPRRIEPRMRTVPQGNREIRAALKDALTAAFGVERLEELPSDVRKVLKIGDFKVSKNGEVCSHRPLTLRRIRAILEAVRKVAVDSTESGRMRRAVENEFGAGFSDGTQVEAALKRNAVASGRQPLSLTMPGGAKVEVPLAWMTAYVKDVPAGQLAAKVDMIRDEIQADIAKGCALYWHLRDGRRCVSSSENKRALRHYIALAAYAAGKGTRSRYISLADENGMLAKFLGDGRDGVRRVKPNETISGSVGRLFIFSDIDCPQAGDMLNVQKDLVRRYRKLESNPYASDLLRRRTRNGNLSIAQMQSNLTAEIRRMTLVGDEELCGEALRELGYPAFGNEAAKRDAVAQTCACRNFYTYKADLNECLRYLQFVRSDLDHPEARAADEVVLSDGEMAAIGQRVADDSVLLPRNIPPDGVNDAPGRDDGGFGTLEWRFEQIGKCAGGDLKTGIEGIVYMIRNGMCPADGLSDLLLPLYSDIPERPHENAMIRNFVQRLDARWLADVVWYRACSGHLEDNGLVKTMLEGGDTVQEGVRPVWNALRDGVLSRNIPEETMHRFFMLLTKEDPGVDLVRRIGERRFRAGFSAGTTGDAAIIAASKAWGFGTCDVDRAVRYIGDCGYRLETVSDFDLDKLSTLAALVDYRLEDVATFVQRQTGKSPAEISQKEIVDLFRLKIARKLNDKGALVKGVSGDIVSVLKGDRLPSMTGATGKDMTRLLSAMRSLSSAAPGSAWKVDFLGRAVSLRLTYAGTLVFGVDGFEFRAGKTPREFIEILENDAVSNPGKFGIHIVLKMLPQIRGAQMPDDPVLAGRTRELCLRFLKGAAGIEPAMLAGVSTRELYSIAEGVADGRYRLSKGGISENAVRSMLEERLETLNVLTSQEAAELCRGLENLRTGTVEVRKTVPSAQARRDAETEKVKAVHDLIADLVLDVNPLDYDRFQNGSQRDARVLAVLRRHVPAISACVGNPELLSSFPPAVSGVIRDAFGGMLEVFAGVGILGNISDEIRQRHIRFLLDTVDKPVSVRERAVDAYLLSLEPKPDRDTSAAEAGKNGAKSFLSSVAGAVSSFVKGGRQPSDSPKPRVSTTILKRPMLAALGALSRTLNGAEGRIDAGVQASMVQVQNIIAASMDMPAAEAGREHPLWSRDFDEIVGNAMSSAAGGYGMFVQNVLQTYFISSSILEQRQMLASLVRGVDATSSDGAMLGALFRGAGPLLQKMLQGLPPAVFGEELADALKDVKSNLQPIPEVFVKAGMKRIIDRSGGRIRSITVERSLGAASVGQAFLCRMVTDEHPQGEECVVKLLRPTVKTAIARERRIFEAAAAAVPGMAKTFEGQLSRILEELDFTLEATNIDFGRNVYEQPVYLRQKSALTGEIETLYMHSLHSMEVHPLAAPTMDCLVLKKAPGETYDRYMAETRRTLEELRSAGTMVNGRLGFGNVMQAVQAKRKLIRLYADAVRRHGFLVDLTKKWVHEGMFGNGFYHGDLHAGNIMSDGRGLTVIDFGNATHLSGFERAHVLQMVSAALVGWHETFEKSFRSLLSPEGRAAYDLANNDGHITRDLADIMHKGTSDDVGMRISAALMVLQRHGIEVPGSIYNFNQCQMRLGATVGEMQSLIDEINVLMRNLTIADPDLGISRHHSMSNTLLKIIIGIDDYGKGRNNHEYSFRTLESFMGGRDANGEWNPIEDALVMELAEEWSREEIREDIVYPLLDKLGSVRRIGPDGEAVRNDEGGREDLAALAETFRRKNPMTITLSDRIHLATAVLQAVQDYCDMMKAFTAPVKRVRTVSFLEAVGTGISDSVYSVRTTLGNVQAVELMRAQAAEDRRVSDIHVRMTGSDERVREYLQANPRSGLTQNDVGRIRQVALRMTLPFDMPGLDGKNKWLKAAAERGRFYEVLQLAVRRLLEELQRQGVVADLTDVQRCRHCVRIAIRYLVDHSGGLFDAFAGMRNSQVQELLAEAGGFARRLRTAEGDHGVLDMEVLHRQCFLAAIGFIASGGTPVDR